MLIEQMVKRLRGQTSFESAAQVILNDVIALHGAELGNLQLKIGDHLVIVVQRGFKASFLKFFREVKPQDGCACGRAFRTGRPVAITDIEADEEFAPYRAVARAAGLRSVVTTPLLTRGHVLLGAVSAHFVNVHRPTAIEMDTLSVYSLTAADHLHALLDGDSLEAKALAMSRRLYDEVVAEPEQA